MRKIAERIFRLFGSREFLLFLILALTFYIGIERVGLFRLEPAHYREIFHSLSCRVLGTLFVVHAVSGIIFLFKEKQVKHRAGSFLFFLSIIVMVLGLWVSIFTRFEGKTLKSELERFNAFKSEYDPRSLYITNEKRIPRVRITVVKIDPDPSSYMKSMDRITADILYSSRSFRGVRDGKLSSYRPLFSDWTMVRITDFGYVPKYVLYDLQEKELESRWVHMKLFPAGAEDYFEAMFMGYLFYLKCYPDYTDEGGVPGTLSVVPNNPVFNLRIIRNKDIVYDGLLKPDEKLRFDRHVVAVPEVKVWIEISFVRDFGLPVGLFGMVMMAAGVGLMMRKR